jgi:hypothetical protein
MKIDWLFWVTMAVGGMSWLLFEADMVPLAVVFGLVCIGLIFAHKIAEIVDSFRSDTTPQEGEVK